MNSFFQEILGFFREDNTNSMTRVILFLAHGITWPAWALSCWHEHRLVELPSTLLVFHGTVAGLKLAQKPMETDPKK